MNSPSQAELIELAKQAGFNLSHHPDIALASHDDIAKFAQLLLQREGKAKPPTRNGSSLSEPEIRWVNPDGTIGGGPTDHDCREHLEKHPGLKGCHCAECGSHQPTAQGGEVVREAVLAGAMAMGQVVFDMLTKFEHETGKDLAARSCAIHFPPIVEAAMLELAAAPFQAKEQ